MTVHLTTTTARGSTRHHVSKVRLVTDGGAVFDLAMVRDLSGTYLRVTTPTEGGERDLGGFSESLGGAR